MRSPQKRLGANRYVALLGRPNVGKSTLFNYLHGGREALVADFPQLTRDRRYGVCKLDNEHCFTLIDTGGLESAPKGLSASVSEQAWLAVEEADLVLLVLDARTGASEEDRHIARMLRRRRKSTLLIANKIDGLDERVAGLDFYELGFDKVISISAINGIGGNKLREALVNELPDVEQEAESAAKNHSGTPVAFIGRPNSGKSTLINRLLGTQRAIASDTPGTTRDCVHIPWQIKGKDYVLIDTAGVRRRRSTRLMVEKFSIIKTLQAIDQAVTAVILIDGSDGLVDQDMRLIGMGLDAGCSLVIAVNKWDALNDKLRDELKNELQRRLGFLDFVAICYISALRGRGLSKLLQALDDACQSAAQSAPTTLLCEILQRAVHYKPPPMGAARSRIKLRYAHMGGSTPPLVVIHGNQTEKVPTHYKRYLAGYFRRELQLSGTPVKIEFRSSDNPYAKRRNQLTTRQLKRRARLLTHRRQRAR